MFLATTALKEYWKFDQDILLAGDWFRIFGQDLPKNTKISTLSYIWTNASDKNEIQNLRKEFIENYALTSKSWISNWSKTFLS